MTDINIRPCPFCGCEDVIIFEDGPEEVRAVCGECGSQTPITASEEAAIRFWNMRDPSSNWISFTGADPETFFCMNCKKDTADVSKGICPHCGIPMDGGFRFDKTNKAHWWDYSNEKEDEHE